jgi:multidrug efflux pump subunit AcrB
LTAELDRVLDEIEDRLPEGMKLDRHVFPAGGFHRGGGGQRADGLARGVVLVVLVVLVFPGQCPGHADHRAGDSAVARGGRAHAPAFGATINTMTLGGMAIAIGALVDDAVIDVENVFRRLREKLRRAPAQRRSAWQVVYAASVEIRGSIVFATLIIALVFVPLLFLSGVEGRLMRPLGVAYLVALMASLSRGGHGHARPLLPAVAAEPGGARRPRAAHGRVAQASVCPAARTHPRASVAVALAAWRSWRRRSAACRSWAAPSCPSSTKARSR